MIMSERKSAPDMTYRITFAAMMAAMIFVVTMFRFPLLGSKVHFANAVCLLSGMLLGPVTGGVASGLGSAIYDVYGGYDFVGVLITFVSKFAMGYVTGLIMQKWESPSLPDTAKTVVAAVAGAFTYVALYMLKTFIYQRYVYGFAMDAVGATMISKLIPSLINAAVAVVAAPIFYYAIRPVLAKTGLIKHMRPGL